MSDVWIKAHNDLQKQHNEANCKFEKVILGLIFWSDLTHLANFETAKVWPLYFCFQSTFMGSQAPEHFITLLIFHWYVFNMISCSNN